MRCNIDFKTACNVGAGLAMISTVTAGVARLAGYSIGLLNGAGFGFIQGTITKLALDKMPEICPQKLRGPLSLAVGGLTAFGASHAVAALGFIAAPISVPAAIILTVVNVALPLLCLSAYKSCCAKNSKKEKVLSPEEQKALQEKALAEEAQKKAAEAPAAPATT